MGLEREASKGGRGPSACGYTFRRIRRILRDMALRLHQRFPRTLGSLGGCMDGAGLGARFNLCYVLWWWFGESATLLPSLVPLTDHLPSWV